MDTKPKPDYHNADTLTMYHPSCTKGLGCEIEDCNCMCHYKGKDIDWEKFDNTRSHAKG